MVITLIMQWMSCFHLLYILYSLTTVNGLEVLLFSAKNIGTESHSLLPMSSRRKAMSVQLGLTGKSQHHTLKVCRVVPSVQTLEMEA